MNFRTWPLLYSATLAAVAFAAGAVWAQKPSPIVRVLDEQLAAIKAGQAARYAATYADNGIVMAQGRPMVRGRDAIQKDSTAQIAEAGTQLEGKPFDSGMSGDLGYAAYSGIVTLKDGKKNPYHGVTVFRRVDGQWKAIIDASMDSVPQVKQ